MDKWEGDAENDVDDGNEKHEGFYGVNGRHGESNEAAEKEGPEDK